jgi:hypothetical protein
MDSYSSLGQEYSDSRSDPNPVVETRLLENFLGKLQGQTDDPLENSRILKGNKNHSLKLLGKKMIVWLIPAPLIVSGTLRVTC